MRRRDFPPLGIITAHVAVAEVIGEDDEHIRFPPLACADRLLRKGEAKNTEEAKDGKGGADLFHLERL